GPPRRFREGPGARRTLPQSVPADSPAVPPRQARRDRTRRLSASHALQRRRFVPAAPWLHRRTEKSLAEADRHFHFQRSATCCPLQARPRRQSHASRLSWRTSRARRQLVWPGQTNRRALSRARRRSSSHRRSTPRRRQARGTLLRTRRRLHHRGSTPRAHHHGTRHRHQGHGCHRWLSSQTQNRRPAHPYLSPRRIRIWLPETSYDSRSPCFPLHGRSRLQSRRGPRRPGHSLHRRRLVRLQRRLGPQIPPLTRFFKRQSPRPGATAEVVFGGGAPPFFAHRELVLYFFALCVLRALCGKAFSLSCTVNREAGPDP